MTKSTAVFRLIGNLLSMLKMRFAGLFLLALFASPSSLAAQNTIIVRDVFGNAGLSVTCFLLGCKVTEQLDGSVGNLFLIQAPLNTSLGTFLAILTNQIGIVDAEPDQLLHVMQASTAPSGLYDTTPVNYYGTTAWDGYVNQPAVQIVNLQAAQSLFPPGSTGSGIVAVIDTGVDPTQPVLQNVLLPGEDFTRNKAGGSEMADVNQSTMAVINGAEPAQVNQSTMAVINQQGSSTFSQSQYAAFGHGTMTSGIVHLVAPTAQIMPLKAFHADGTGELSDILRAIYYATQNGANVLNMSFDFTTYSRELDKAMDYATDHGVVGVASVGNDGEQIIVYPAGLNNVIGVASTTNNDTLSSFSNYGQPPVWVGAPGEGIITTYPYGTYAAGWGTSFSAPFVSGTVALLMSLDPNVTPQSAAQAISNARYISPALGYGRLDIYQAVTQYQPQY